MVMDVVVEGVVDKEVAKVVKEVNKEVAKVVKEVNKELVKEVNGGLVLVCRYGDGRRGNHKVGGGGGAAGQGG